MDGSTLKVCVSDTVVMREGSRVRARRYGPQRAYFQPEFVFTMDKDVAWAPSRSRAPSVTIDFGLSEAMGF